MPAKSLSTLSNDELLKFLRIHNQLSPENLSCDGELSRTQVAARYKTLTTELKALQQAHGLSNDQIDEGLVYAEFEARGRPR